MEVTPFTPTLGLALGAYVYSVNIITITSIVITIIVIIIIAMIVVILIVIILMIIVVIGVLYIRLYIYMCKDVINLVTSNQPDLTGKNMAIPRRKG